MVRHNNQLPDNLPQLQNLIKRDPESYKDNFLQQYRHYESVLEIFKLSPDKENKKLDELVMFLAQVAQCYPEELKMFPQQLVELLRSHSTNLDPDMRNTFCRALILLRNKQLVSALDLLELFFQLLNCQDKNLRSFLETHIITDIKNMNAKHKDMKLNSTLQNFMFSQLKNAMPKAAKMSIDIMIELYKKNVWNDAKTVNVIATVGCFSKCTKVQVASLKFFLGHDKEEEEESDDSENEPDLKSAIMANRVNKKTKKRQKQLDSAKKLFVKAQKKKRKAEVFNFSAVHLIHNPQGMAENLFKQLQSTNERFEVKLMHLDVISRLIGIHELFLFSFYPYIMRFMQPHQRQVTRILQFAAQASHELIPPEIIEPLIKTLVNNFVTERNSSDVMAVGLNAAREICSRCPLAMSEDLLRDLALYKNYKEKSVVMAARSLIALYREQLPALLHKKDRGRPTEAQAELKPKKYGEIQAVETIPGAEALLKAAPEVTVKEKGSKKRKREDDDEWVDVSDDDGEDFGSDFETCSDEEDENDENEEENDSEDEENSEEEEDKDSEEEENESEKGEKSTEVTVDKEKENSGVQILDEKEAAKEIALTRIFTDEDFARIEAELVKKKVTNARKRPLEQERQEFVKLDDIEMIYKKRRTDKQARLESMQKGREGREKFGYKDGRLNIHCSKTNREKRKNKNFQMIRHKEHRKIKSSFRDKQLKLRKHLMNQKKMR
ncbi:protein SDA1 homolog [Culicoides brevitarsis]|uniref:protein SDA1 homolog n=1 Tax=Culicoides brevitarsis TaxID=469753 RepID=UPI00307BA3DB